MPVRVDVRPELLRWAKERARADEEALVRRFPKLPEWERGDLSPTLKQLEGFARATHTPIGFLFLPEPPEEPIPIPDYRTIGDVAIRRPSADLLDTIFEAQQRQEWYRSFSQVTGEDPVPFIGSFSTSTSVEDAASSMRETLDFGVDQRGPTYTDALRHLAENAEERGVLVMVNGVVGSNTHRKLNPHEFRGFSLVDRLAPLVFINGADSKAAQIFTLAHELAHIWLGEEGLDDVDLTVSPTLDIERWCNRVAAEFLVSADDLRAAGASADSVEELDSLARTFKVSTLVLLRRLHDIGALGWDEYRSAYREELDRVLAIIEERGGGGGGDFYNTQPVRVSKRFARALIASTLEGQTLYTEAFRMLGFKKLSTFQELANRLGVS